MTEQIEIQVEDLHKSFGKHDVLCGVDLNFNSGEIIAIVGGSGCGKTVLMNTILGEYAPDKGIIRILDRSGKNWKLKDLSDFGELEIDDVHRHWGVVFQRNALFSGSVFFNLALWLHEIKGMDDESIMPIARRSLEAVGLPTDQSFLEKSSNDLSGGMAKRVAIARAISMDPYLFFYDEPTTGLDPTSSANITHDKDLLNRLRPRTVMLYQGKVYFDGPFEEFEASSSEVIRPYFKLMPILQGRFREEVIVKPNLASRKGLVV